jgi:ATP-binding cassette subfamily B protein
VGDVMARVTNDVRQLNAMMNPGTALIGDTVIGMTVPLVFIAFLDARLLAAPLAFIIVFVFALRHYMGQLNPVAGAMRRQFGVMNAGLNETITGIELVKSAAQEHQEKGKFVASATTFRDHFVRHGEVQARYLPILLYGFTLTAAFAQGLWLLSAGQLSVGELVAYVGLVGALRGLADISIFSFSLVQLGLAGAERILELIREKTELDENPAGHAARVAGEIVFDGVTFGYDGAKGRPALSELSFTAAPGQTVAIVGQTGSGKTSLVKLVNRVHDADLGRVLIDGVDVRDWNLESLRQQISVIEQDLFLFSRTVAENIAFGVTGASREAVVAAAQAAQADEFIHGFADGYDTVIGERGVTLSGGQRQRLAIARALLTDPRILILDDSTSAIDSATEDAIQKAINKVLEGRTTLMITHRLSQIRRADKILVLDRGRLIDQGTHAELLAHCSLYARIFARYES